ncbi:unnamed protein product [Toxocara canis]|uniref:Triacylglycerol lipase n=1 Tax=Toxocara canis TaxID=6265 RepID=A0A183U4N6_TOXCA|nr:unnamed protein product [Toxocara canis]
MATSVHNVHPSQIGVVAALGDSFSALIEKRELYHSSDLDMGSFRDNTMYANRNQVGYGASPDDVRMLNSHPQFSFSMGLGGVLKEHITIPSMYLETD